MNSLTCNTCALKELCHDIELNTKELSQLNNITSTSITIEKGQSIFKYGDDVSSIYAIRSGSIKLVNSNGRILDFFLSGDFIGLDAFDDHVHKSNAIAIEQTILCTFNFNEIIELMEVIPRFSQYFLSILSKQLNHQLNSFNHHLDSTQRVSNFFIKISNHNYIRGFSATDFTLSMKRQDIANYLDLAIETISRTLHTLADDKIIEVKNKQVHIMDLAKLKNKCH